MSTQQFSLNDKGEILFQPQANNPTPGEAVAILARGNEALNPTVTIVDKAKDHFKDDAEAKLKIEQWFDTYLKETLEPLVQLQDPNLSGASKAICDAVYAAMGVVPRAELEADIKKLDEQGRAQIRFKKVKLGPILVFIPLLNKPAAIKLRAVLWGIWYQKELPVTIPADGIVSQTITDIDVNPHLYQTIGFPIYGPRAVRIDMLDRVVVDLYDQSKNWKFQARHKYCEWLGCTIEDLYLILEAMGHKKMDDVPEDAKKPDAEDDKNAKDEKPSEEEKGAEDGADEKASEDASANASAEKTEEEAMPELAWFQLKRDKAGKKTPHKSKSSPKKTGGKKKGQKAKGQKKEPKSMSFQIKGDQETSDSPFAVLEQLKKDG